ncbi:mitochondrial genome maintenance protein [Physcia stellaris]|nr:mitochondrial genome maintenance protein [Physcia stellaris]
MATLLFQRAGWSLQISRTSRAFAISFTTALPRRQNPRHLAETSDGLRSSRHRSTPSTRHSTRTSQQDSARSIFTTTKVYQEQQAQRSSTAPVRPTPAEPTTPLPDLTDGLSDQPVVLDEGARQVDWTRSFHGLSSESFPKEAADVLLAPLEANDIEVKPDGIVYLPEIKYRRILNRAFGPGGWGLAPRGETIVTQKAVTREYALVVQGRLVSVARGEMDYFSPEGIPTAAEGCKSNALMRCCKDLGVASELWDPRFIRSFVAAHAKEVWVEHLVTKKKKKVWMRKDDAVRYPFKETRGFGP